MRRHPLVHAGWLETANRLRSGDADLRPTRTWLPVVAILAAIGVAISLGIRWWPLVLGVAELHLTAVGILAALQSSVLVHRGRRKWTAVYSSNWLSTLPITRRAVVGMIAMRSFLGPLVLLLLLIGVQLAAAALQGPEGLAFSLLAVCTAATLVGGLLGWCLPQRAPVQPSPVRMYAVISGGSAAATLAALSSWSVAQTKVWLQPRTLARLFLPAMLLLPLDVSGNVAVALLGVWALALYLFVLLRATVRVAQEGASWLRPTPLTFNRFAWAILRDPLLKQLQWTLMATAFLVALGCKPLAAVRVAEWWLAVVSVTSGIAVAHAYQSRSMRLKLVASVCTLAVIERFRQHLALPCALLFSAWQLRRVART
jgi:hypothetical protein